MAVLCHSYSHAPTSTNSTFGSIDFSVVDQPMLNLIFNTSPNGAATVGAYAVLDIGIASDLRVDICAFSKCFFVSSYSLLHC